MKEPFFSIIIPTFNSSTTLSAAVETVLQQNFGSFEVSVVDGASKDGTLQLLEDFKSRDRRFHYQSQPDKGIYDAMNKGIDQAKGKWLLFLGSDDKLRDNDVLKNVAAKLSDTKAQVIYGNVRIVGDTTWAKDGTIYDGAFDFKKLMQQNICHQSIFYNRAFLNQHSLRYNISYQLLADWDFNLQCFAKTAFEYIDLVIADFFGGGQTTMAGRDETFSRDFVHNVMKYFQMAPFSNKVYQLPDYLLPSIYTIQKRESVLRYYFQRIKRKIVAR